MSHRLEAGIKIPTGNWTATLREYVPEDVVWTAGVNVAITGNTITKNAGGTDWNAQAISTQTIAADGYVEFDTDNQVMCGLSNGDTDYGFADIDFAIYSTGSAYGYAVHIYEGGDQVVTAVATSGAGSSFRVQVVASVVTYWHKPAAGAWTFLYESLGTPTFPLLVDSSIYTEGSAITDAVIASTGAGATITLTAAKTYYHSSAGNDTVDLPARLIVLLDAAGAGTYTVAIDAAESGTGRYTISAGGALTAFTLAFVSAPLKALLGFSANLGTDGNLALTYTSQGAAQGLWLPSSGNGSGIALGTTAIGDDLDETDASDIGTPDSSNVTRFSYNRRGINAVDYQACTAARSRIAYETYANESWQKFWRDCIDGDLSAYLVAVAQVRIYPDAAVDGTYYDYWVRGMASPAMDGIVRGWQDLWTVKIARLERVG